MNEGKKVRLLAGGLVVFLLGMGSSWFVLRDPSPKPAVLVDNTRKERPRRYGPPVTEEKRGRRKVSTRPPTRLEKAERKRSVRKQDIRTRRNTESKSEKRKDYSKSRGC